MNIYKWIHAIQTSAIQGLNVLRYVASAKPCEKKKSALNTYALQKDENIVNIFG